MEDSVRYSCDASFEHLAALVFDGLLYERTLTPIDYLPGVYIARVVPYEPYQQDGDVVMEDAPTKNGPEFVVFHRFVYARSDTDPATIEDDILRTVAPNTLVERLQQMAASAMAFAYVPPEPQPPVQVAPQPPIQVAPQSPVQVAPQSPVQVGPQQPNNPVPHQSRRVMPQRAIVKQASFLEPLFDLEPEERAGVIYLAPSQNNVTAPTTPGMIPNPRRTHWKDEHVKYLDELMELAMLKMNRPLSPSDFKAITEALHRHFRVHGGIPERGWNTVHSYATRKPAYNRLVQRVLPDIGFPDFGHKPRK